MKRPRRFKCAPKRVDAAEMAHARALVSLGGLLLGLSLSGCKGDGGGPSGGPGGNNGPGRGSGNGRGERSSYYLTSSSLAGPKKSHTASLALTVGAGAKTCSIAGTPGLCVTPTRARGMVVNLSLGQAAAGGPTPGAPPPSNGPPQPMPPARLFGGGEGLDREGKISFGPFDLAAPKAIPGEGNLPDTKPGTTFGTLDTLFGYLDVQVPLGDKFWTVRFAFYPQPLAEDPTVKMCVDQARLANIAKNGDVIPGAPAFGRGDVMYCEKAVQTDECTPADFKWLDPASASLVAARPAKPRQLDFIVNEGVTCQLYPEGPTAANHNQPGEIKLQGFRMTSKLTAPISIWGRYEMCNIAFSAKDVATGQTTDGTSLAATVNYDLEGFVFFPGVTNAAAASELDLLRVATLTPLHAREKFGPGPASGDFATATVTVALGKEPFAPCGGPDNWDGSGPPPTSDAGAGPGGPGPGGDGGGPRMVGPGPSDAADGVHPATVMPPGCMPSQPVRLTTETGAACAHTACPAPEWQAVPYTPWSLKPLANSANKECHAFCVTQTCPATGGSPQTITCMPACQ
jgi:hypothetical protein